MRKLRPSVGEESSTRPICTVFFTLFALLALGCAAQDSPSGDFEAQSNKASPSGDEGGTTEKDPCSAEVRTPWIETCVPGCEGANEVGNAAGCNQPNAIELCEYQACLTHCAGEYDRHHECDVSI